MGTAKRALGLAGWLAVSFAAGWIGSRYMPDAWYASLTKPSWTPPGAIFAPVWSVLYVLMGIAAWIVWPKPQPLARLEHTVEVPGRMDARGNEVAPLDEDAVRAALRKLKGDGIEALTVSLMNAYLNGAHEARICSAV